MATLLMADGREFPITKPLTLAGMQSYVGGYIEVVTIGGTPDAREILIVDEDGHGRGKSLNVEATRLYRGHPPRHDGVIVGDAIRCICTHMGTEDEAYA